MADGAAQSYNAKQAAPYWGAGLKRNNAALYCGCSPNHFSKLVTEGLMPPGRDQSGVIVWLRWEIDAALAALPIKGQDAPRNSCDEAFGC